MLSLIRLVYLQGHPNGIIRFDDPTEAVPMQVLPPSAAHHIYILNLWLISVIVICSLIYCYAVIILKNFGAGKESGRTQFWVCSADLSHHKG